MLNLQGILCGIILVLVLSVFSMTGGCTSAMKTPVAPPVTSAVNGTVEKVEVYHFHGNTQCPSCIAIGNLAEKTVNENFKTDLDAGRLVFEHVNYDLPENADRAKKYEVTGSSLWIGVYDATGFHKQQNLAVWYLIDNESGYSQYLSAVLTKRLNGDLS
ncbi:MAG TPA: nitrophenyl compound nitroreductase subunit ArsF family protein [Methanoregula sp.]|nr:nitrophenyl compound nitroreductase subunit ArsF family protein [Methanoregula sp.]